MAIRKRAAYYAATFNPGGPVPLPSPRADRRGITVLGLVLLILAVVVAIVLFTRYYPV